MEAKKILIINADDFGLHSAINEGIVKGLSSGIVTDLSIVSCGSAFDGGIKLLKSIGIKDVGVHLTLVGERSLSLPSDIPSIVRPDGRFFDGYGTFIMRYMSGMISDRDILMEFELQLQRVKDEGFRVTHIDTHQHIHLLPRVADIVIHLAKKMNIGYVRCPFVMEKMWMDKRGIILLMSRYLSRRLALKLKESGISFADSFWGMRSAGRLSKKELIKIIRKLPYGVSEMMCHPAVYNAELDDRYQWGYRWSEELEALTSEEVGELIKEEGVELSDVGSLVGN